MLGKIVFGAILLTGGVIAYMALTADPEAEKIMAEDEARHTAYEEQQQARADAAAQRRQAALRLAEDTSRAKEWGISLSVYHHAESLEEQAYGDCIAALKNSARYDVKSDWTPDYSWNSDGSLINIIGRDVHLQNGFGAYSAGYTCSWDMQTRGVTEVAPRVF